MYRRLPDSGQEFVEGRFCEWLSYKGSKKPSQAGSSKTSQLLTAGCDEVGRSACSWGWCTRRGTCLRRRRLLKKHPCPQESARSNITAKRCQAKNRTEDFRSIRQTWRYV